MEAGTGLQVVWTHHARQALQTIYEYIAADSIRFAEKTDNEIQAFGNSISKFPFVFPECAELPTKKRVYRKATYAGTYKIIYKIVKKEIWILDVFHGKRNPETLKKLRRVKPKLKN